MRFQAGYIYPLADPTNYDDENGMGFTHAAIAHDAEPLDCYIHDAWIVNAEGEVHPGYDACPVPLRKDDVVLAEGRPLESDLPTPKGLFDSPLLRRA